MVSLKSKLRFFFSKAQWVALICYIILLLLFQPHFMGNDNLNFSLAFMWGEASPHTMHMSYLLSYPLAWISACSPPIDPYTFFIYILCVINSWLIGKYVIRTQGNPKLVHALSYVFLVYLFFNYFLIVEYAIISFITMGCACLYLIESTRKKDSIHEVLAALLLITGAALRYDSCLGIIPFLAVCILIEFRGGNKRFLAASAVCLFSIISIFGLQRQLSNTSLWGSENTNLVDVHTSRMAFVDYQDQKASTLMERLRYMKKFIAAAMI